ncbi:MAG: hypothetical protein JWN22_1534 [Nocardioides sp.]|nr:hypothetical protein [Nocardioides sp.]
MSDDPADRMVRLRVARQRVRPHRATSVVVTACLAVGVLAVAVAAVPAVLGRSEDRSSAPPVRTEQRKSATPPAEVPAPACLPQFSSFSPVADPVDMVAARLCVSYNDDGRTTSVAVPTADLATILDAWRTGPTTPEEKGPACGPTTPTWVLSGVTRWGDAVQVTAECNKPTNGSSWVDLAPRAQEVVDQLVARAGIQVDDGEHATTAWALVYAWLTDVNAHAILDDDRSAAVANSLWVRDPWLPEGELDWNLLGASRTEAAGWQQAWQVPARTPAGQEVFVVVRDGNEDPWRILSLTP